MLVAPVAGSTTIAPRSHFRPGSAATQVQQRLLPERLDDHVGGEDEVRARHGPDPAGPRRRVLELGPEELDAPGRAALAEHADRLGEPLEPDAVGLRELVFVGNAGISASERR